MQGMGPLLQLAQTHVRFMEAAGAAPPPTHLDVFARFSSPSQDSQSATCHASIHGINTMQRVHSHSDSSATDNWSALLNTASIPTRQYG